MSILTGNEIINQIKRGRIVIDPFEAKNVGANSVDLRLGDELLCYDVLTLDMKNDNPVYSLHLGSEGIVLHPGILYLGSTVEVAGSEHYVPFIEGRSSIGRLGMSVHVSAGFGDCAFMGTWTLEITVVHPVRIYPGVRVCQIVFSTQEGHSGIKYKGKYQDQKRPRPSQLWRDFRGD